MEDLLITLIVAVIFLTPFIILIKLNLKLKEKNNKRPKKIFILSNNDDGRSREEIIKLTKVRHLEAELRSRKN